MHTRTRPLAPADLEAAAALAGPQRPQLLAHLRWCLHTPYAQAFVHLHADVPTGVITTLAFGGSATIRHLVAAEHEHADGVRIALLQHAIGHHERQGRTALTGTFPEHRVGLLEACGFRRREAYLRFHGERFIEATRDEVELISPTHTIGLLHLDRRVCGQDRAPLLLEHRFAAHVWVAAGRVEGFLLPTLGQGLVVADTPAIGLELQRWLLPHQHEVIVPAANTPACDHLEERGYTASLHGLRMEYGDPLAVDAGRLFGVGW
ncbi:MAG: hypothetical protein H6597_03170 [Flavobacteriales bacterium]|nr:hypothetical protein [Flavobacteriales bacterium]MCB9193507.1 hypothetical protein [Flavobacteriales bacterium]